MITIPDEELTPEDEKLRWKPVFRGVLYCRYCGNTDLRPWDVNCRPAGLMGGDDTMDVGRRCSKCNKNLPYGSEELGTYRVKDYSIWYIGFGKNSKMSDKEYRSLRRNYPDIEDVRDLPDDLIL